MSLLFRAIDRTNFFGLNHSSSMHICVPNLVMIGPVVWPPIADTRTHRHTHARTHAHTHNLYYIDIL